MVVNEKALVREMKAAFKSGGYTVAVREGGDWVITADGWAAVIEGIGNVPREALSLIVLHMGFLPRHGEAWEVFKGQNGPLIQKAALEVKLATLRKVETLASDAANVRDIRPTRLWLGNDRVWQQPENLRVALVDPRHSGIMKEPKFVTLAGNWLCLEGEISWVYVRAEDDEGCAAQTEHLSGMQWTAE